MTPPSPTPELLKQIVAWVRGGCYAQVAAQACGVPRRLFRHWLKRGHRKNAPPDLANFAMEIYTAGAAARLVAEIETYQSDKRAWLEHGPGRDRPDEPGWSSSARAGTINQDDDNPLANPELMRLFNKVLKALEDYPEARAHVAEILAAEPLRMKTNPNPGPKPTQPEGVPHDPQLSPAQ